MSIIETVIYIVGWSTMIGIFKFPLIVVKITERYEETKRIAYLCGRKGLRTTFKTSRCIGESKYYDGTKDR